jgi:hypothetical protein
MAYPLSLYKNDAGNLVEKVVKSANEESFYRKLNFVAAGEGFLQDPASPLNNEGKPAK